MASNLKKLTGIYCLGSVIALVNCLTQTSASDSCTSDELHYLPRLPDFFEYVPIRRHAAHRISDIDAEIDKLLYRFNEVESTCSCNGTQRNRHLIDNARLCPRTSAKIEFDTRHCRIESWHHDFTKHTWQSSAEFTSVDSLNSKTKNRGRGRRPGDGRITGRHGNHDQRYPGIIDGNRWLKNSTMITPMTSRHSTSHINLHILIGIVVITILLVIVLFGSMSIVWWMRKRTEFNTTHPFSGDCKRWFSWCKWSKKTMALRNAPTTGPFNNPVFCVGNDGDREDREDVLSRSFESASQKRDSGYVGVNGTIPVLDLQMSPYRCYRPLRTDPADISRDAEDEDDDDDGSFAESSSVDTESVVVTPTTPCSFITFNLDFSQSREPLRPPLQTSV